MFLILSIESVVYPILAWNNSYYMMAVSFIHIIVDGLGRIVIAWVVISTMTITEEHNVSVQPTPFSIMN
ncbi:hypothetical protein CPB86DRAFT_778818 [Serendipita vermifera]|nr:hypothetical protein CPB86DRAFT_778818 [Serendipita vermifera]